MAETKRNPRSKVRTGRTKKGTPSLLEQSRNAYEKWLDEYDPNFRECRTSRRHDWVGVDKIWRVSDHYYGSKPECSRCGFTENRLLHADTLTIATVYNRQPPADYLKPPETRLAIDGAVPVSVFRRMWWEIDEAPDEDLVADAQAWLAIHR